MWFCCVHYLPLRSREVSPCKYSMCEALLLPPSRAVGKCTSEDRMVGFWALGVRLGSDGSTGLYQSSWVAASSSHAPPMARHQGAFLTLIEFRFTNTSKRDKGRKFKRNPQGAKFFVLTTKQTFWPQ